MDYKVIVRKGERTYLKVPTNRVGQLVDDLTVENNNLFDHINILPTGLGYFKVTIYFEY